MNQVKPQPSPEFIPAIEGWIEIVAESNINKIINKLKCCFFDNAEIILFIKGDNKYKPKYIVINQYLPVVTEKKLDRSDMIETDDASKIIKINFIINE